MKVSRPTRLAFSLVICAFISFIIVINLFLCVSKGSAASAVFRFVCAVATAAARLSSVVWKSVESATMSFIKLIRFVYAVSKAVSVARFAVTMNLIDSNNVVNTGAELSSVSTNMLLIVPR